LKGRCDSFVVETHVHYPTDINLLFDAARKVIQQTAELCKRYKRSDWRQYQYNIKQIKRLMRIIQKKKRSGSKNESQKNKVAHAIKDAHREYIALTQKYLDKAQATIKVLEKTATLKMQDLPIIDSMAHFESITFRGVFKPLFYNPPSAYQYRY